MVYYNIYNQNLDCIKTSYSELSEFNKIYSNFSQRDSRIIKLDFDGDIAQIIIKTNGFIIKLYPIACIYKSDESKQLIVLNTDNIEVKEYIKYIFNGRIKINNLDVISFIENLLCFHSDNLDKKIKYFSNSIKSYTFDNIESQQLTKIAKILHELLLLKNQYQEIQQTLTQINDLPSDKLKIISEISKIEEFSRIINIYQNQFEEDVKNLSRMVKEIEILIQMTDIKFAEKRNKIALLSLNLDFTILFVSIVSMFGSIFGMNLNSALEDIEFGLYFILTCIVSLATIFYTIIKNRYSVG